MALPLFNIGGLASGLDTSAIIDSLIEVERIPINQLLSRKADYEAKDSAWQDVNTRLSAVRAALGAIDSRNDLNTFATAQSSNESVVTATTTGPITPGALMFTVESLATVHQLASDTDFSGADALVGAGDLTLTVAGTDHTVTAIGSTTLAELAQQVNALDVGVRASVISTDGVTSKLLLTAEESGADAVFSTSATIASLSDFGTVEQGSDAELTVGTGPDALTITRSSNTISDLIAGTSITLQSTSATAVTVTTSRDTAAAADAIKTFMTELNTTLSELASLTDYNAEAQTGGVLVGDATARSLIIDLRSSISATVNEASVDYPIASSIGISLNRTGTFDVDSAKLQKALDADFDAVLDLILESGNAIDARASFVSASSATVEGSYEIVISQAAQRATALSDKYKKPNADTDLQILVGGTTVDVTILRNADVDEAVDAFNAALSAAGVTAVTASKVTTGPQDYVQFDHTSVGSAGSFQIIGDFLNLAGTYTGVDVAGTIGGEAATGTGRTLTATAGDPNGLTLTITATAAEVAGAGGALSLGNVDYESGVFGNVDRVLDEHEGAAGKIARTRDTWQSQISLIDDRIDVLEDRIERRESLLIRQFAALETAMSTLSSQAAWLAAQLTTQLGGAQ